MASLWAIITGLGALIGGEEKNPRSAHTVLLQPVQAGGPKTPSGEPIPRHETRIRLSAGGPDINVEYQKVVLPGSPAPANLTAGDILLPLGEGLESPALRIRDILLPDVTETRLTGGQLWPIQVQESFDLTKLSLAVTLQLTGALDVDDATNVISKSKSVANGLLYRKPLDVGDEPVVRVGSATYSPAFVASGQTGNLPVVVGEDNYVFWLTNTGDGTSREGIAREIDLDFFLLYDWLEDEEVTRYVPIINFKGEDIVNPPGQCMFGYATG